MIFIFFNPEERKIALQLALRLEEAGITAHLYNHSDKQRNVSLLSDSKAIILILSPFSLTTFEQYKTEIELVRHSKKTILPLLHGMNRAEFDTKQTQWKEIVGTSASIQIKEDTIGEFIPKIVSGLLGIGIKPHANVDAEKISFIRSQISNETPSEKTEQSSKPITIKKNRFSLTPILIGLSVLLLGAIGGYFYYQQHAIPEEKIILRIHGSNTIGAKLAPALVEGFIKHLGGYSIQWKAGAKHDEKYAVFNHPDSTSKLAIEVFAHGSSFAFRDLGNKICDIGMSSREVKNEEAILLQSRGLGDMLSQSNEHVLALDGLGIIVHPNNPVRSLTVEQVGKIFSGEIVNWKSITGINATITLYARDTNSGTHETFNLLVLKRIHEDHISGDAKYFEDSDELSKAVGMDPQGIGFIGFAYAKDNKILAIGENSSNSLFANFLTIGREDYPLTRRLFFYTSATPENPLTREFVSYALSPEGQKIVHNAKFVDLNVRVEHNPVLPSNAPLEYGAFVKETRRISVNFRFQKGKNILDTKALSDLERIIEYLKENGYPQIKLAGFSDNEGSKDENVKLSLERAHQIAEEFRARGINIPESNVAGFGDELAVTANKTPEGKAKNRRVEVWLQ